MSPLVVWTLSSNWHRKCFNLLFRSIISLEKKCWGNISNYFISLIGNCCLKLSLALEKLSTLLYHLLMEHLHMLLLREENTALTCDSGRSWRSGSSSWNSLYSFVYEVFFCFLGNVLHFMERRGFFPSWGTIMVGCNWIFQGMNHWFLGCVLQRKWDWCHLQLPSPWVCSIRWLRGGLLGWACHWCHQAHVDPLK